MINAQQLIFLVDDDEDDRGFFEEALSKISYPTDIQSFSNGVDLMANLFNKNQRLPDMLFIDLNMPLMNGQECIEDIKKERCLKNIPIIVYSTATDEDELEKLIKLGVNAYLQKPNTFSKLKSKLELTILDMVSLSESCSQSKSFTVI